MKIKADFVTNSSSTSYQLFGIPGGDSIFEKITGEEIIKDSKGYIDTDIFYKISEKYQYDYGMIKFGEFIGVLDCDTDVLRFVGISVEEMISLDMKPSEFKKEFVKRCEKLGVTITEKQVCFESGESNSEC